MPKPELETPEYAAMLRRMIRAYENRLAHACPDDLAEALTLVDYLETAVGAAIRAMRAEYGISWTTIGTALGTTRQAAFQRFGAGVDTRRPAELYRSAVDIERAELGSAS